MTIKIAICGKMCSGKTYLSNKIAKHYSLKKISIGDKVKEIAIELFNMSYKDRKLLQKIGTNMRLINKDVWINYIIKKNTNNIIIDDLRYINEAKLLKKNNWLIIRLNISSEKQIKRLKLTYPKTYKNHINNLNHESENQINNLTKYIDIDIDNNNLENAFNIIKSKLDDYVKIL